MREIFFDWVCVDERRAGQLSLPYGAGDESWHLHIKGYCGGQLLYRQRSWEVYKTILDTEDIQILGEIVIEHAPEWFERAFERDERNIKMTEALTLKNE